MKLVKHIFKKIIINIEFAVGSLFKKYRCPLCHSRKSLSLMFKGWPYFYLRCNGCDLVFVANLSEKFYKQFIQSAHLYQEIHKFEYQKWQNWKIETFKALGFSDFGENLERKGKKILEVGPAEGKLLEIFRNRGWDVTGIEPNKYFAEICKGEGLDVLNGYVEDVSFANQSFNLILAAHVLEHLKDPVMFLKKIFFMLKDNGRLILEVPLTIDYYNARHLFYFSKRSLTKLLKDNHFIIIKDFSYTDKVYQQENLAVMARKN